MVNNLQNSDLRPEVKIHYVGGTVGPQMDWRNEGDIITGIFNLTVCNIISGSENERKGIDYLFS